MIVKHHPFTEGLLQALKQSGAPCPARQPHSWVTLPNRARIFMLRQDFDTLTVVLRQPRQGWFYFELEISAGLVALSTAAQQYAHIFGEMSYSVPRLSWVCQPITREQARQHWATRTEEEEE